MFGFAMTIIAFEWINYVKLVIDKSELNVKWFMFECIYIKMNLAINLRLRSNVEKKSYKF